METSSSKQRRRREVVLLMLDRIDDSDESSSILVVVEAVVKDVGDPTLKRGNPRAPKNVKSNKLVFVFGGGSSL